MQIGDIVWIFDENMRVYKDQNGKTTNSPWYRGYFVERYIVGETSKSWIVGYKRNTPEDRSNLKVNKKTLEYNGWNGNTKQLYTSEIEIEKICWMHDNQYTLTEDVRKCRDYNKLIKIRNILDEKE